MKLYLINPINSTYETTRKGKFCIVKEIDRNELEEILQGSDLLKGKILGSSDSERDLCSYTNVTRHMLVLPDSRDPSLLIKINPNPSEDPEYPKDPYEIYFTPDHWNSAQEIPVSDFPLYASSMKYMSREFENMLKGKT